MPTLRYELQVWAAGVQTTTSAPAFTLRAQLGHPGFTVPGQIVRPAEGRAESQSWQCTVVDVGSTFTAKLASTAGRMWLLNRLARLRVAQDSTASSSYQTVATQRITDVALGENIAEYSLTLNDERFIERNTELFGKITTPTVAIYPASLLVDWAGYTPWPRQNMTWELFGAVRGNLRALRCTAWIGGYVQTGHSPFALWRPSAMIAQTILSDVKVDAIPPFTTQTVGNFQFLRYHDLDLSADYEVATFDYIGPYINLGFLPQTIVAFWQHGAYVNTPAVVTVIDPAGTLTGKRHGYLYMPNAPASPSVPYHIGGSVGLHPFVVAQQVYDGTFSSSTGLRARYKTAAFTTLQQNPKFGRVYFRITGPEMMDQWLERRLYAPFNVAPLLDSSGQVTPTALHLPQNADPNTYTSLTATNLRGPHPSWAHPSRETVTSLVFQTEGVAAEPSSEFSAADRLLQTTGTIRKTHDTLQTLGKHEVNFMLPMFANIPHVILHFPLVTGDVAPSAQSISSMMAREVFDRYGDGPILTDVQALAAVDATTNGRINPGQFVVMNLGTYPNPATLARSGTRILQVLSRSYDPRGPVFSLLDAGPNLAPTSAPSLAVVRSSQSTRHGVKVTVSGLAAGSRFMVQLAKTSSTGSTAAPATGSTQWWVPTGGNGSTSDTVFHVGALPAGFKIWGRALSQRPGRIRSAWSASASTVLAKLPGLTFRITTGITGGWAVTKWTLGSTVYPIAYFLKLSTASGLTSTQLVTKLPPRSTSFTIEGLKPSTKYRWGVRHVDAYGGQSTLLTTSFATSTALTAAPQPRGLKILS
jgi:hypothetical protein